MTTGDFTRICDRCGTRRYLPKEIAKAKAPRAGKVKRIDRAARIGAVAGTRYAQQSMALHTQQDRVLDAGRCQSCGSSEFHEYPPGSEPPAAQAPPAPAPPPPPPPPAYGHLPPPPGSAF